MLIWVDQFECAHQSLLLDLSFLRPGSGFVDFWGAILARVRCLALDAHDLVGNVQAALWKISVQAAPGGRP